MTATWEDKEREKEASTTNQFHLLFKRLCKLTLRADCSLLKVFRLSLLAIPLKGQCRLQAFLAQSSSVQITVEILARLQLCYQTPNTVPGVVQHSKMRKVTCTLSKLWVYSWLCCETWIKALILQVGFRSTLRGTLWNQDYICTSTKPCQATYSRYLSYVIYIV